MRKAYSLFIAVLLLIPAVSFAGSLEHPYLMRSVRALGMGDAFYAKSDDKYAPFYNPAGLARVEKWRLDILSVGAGVNENGLGTYSDAESVDFNDESETADFLRDIIGDYQHFDANAYPAFVKKNFVVGVFGAARMNAVARNKAYPSLDVEATVDGGVVGGLSASFLKNDRLKVGVAGKLVTHRELEGVYTAVDISSDNFDETIEDDMTDLTGVLADAGVMYTVWDEYDLRVAAAVNNINGSGLGDVYNTTVNFSVGITPKVGDMKLDVIADLRDVTFQNTMDNDLGKRINIGAELGLWDTLYLRAGIHQGYMSYGAGVDLKIVRIDYAQYTEEMGAYAGQVSDYRQALEISVGF